MPSKENTRKLILNVPASPTEHMCDTGIDNLFAIACLVLLGCVVIRKSYWRHGAGRLFAVFNWCVKFFLLVVL